jgi:hypothetical protein
LNQQKQEEDESLRKVECDLDLASRTKRVEEECVDEKRENTVSKHCFLYLCAVQTSVATQPTWTAVELKKRTSKLQYSASARFFFTDDSPWPTNVNTLRR